MRYIIGLIALTGMVMQSWGAYPSGASTEGTADAAALYAWVTAQKKIAANLTNANAFANQDGDAKNVSLYQVGGKNATTPVFWTSNMDVDCDGSTNALCNATDPSHQCPMSCGCGVCEGGKVDPGTMHYMVIPGCSDCSACAATPANWGPFDYHNRGIAYGQIAAIIYKAPGTTTYGVCYAPFLDEDGCATEIGEASAFTNNFLGVNPNPATGGSDDNLVDWIVFPGTANRISSADYTNHAKAVQVGEAAAALLLGTSVNAPTATFQNAAAIDYQISKQNITIKSNGNHSISVFSLNGENVMAAKGFGAKIYNMATLKSGTYIVKINTESGMFTDKVMVY